MTDLACACAHWEDENKKYEESQKTSATEASAIGNVLEDYRKQIQDR